MRGFRDLVSALIFLSFLWSNCSADLGFQQLIKIGMVPILVFQRLNSMDLQVNYVQIRKIGLVSKLCLLLYA